MRRRRFARVGPRRKFSWESAIIGGFDLISNGATVAGWARVPANALDTTISTPQRVEPDATLTRTRIIVSYGTNNGGAQVANEFNVAFGLIAWEGLTDDPADLAPLLPNPAIDGALDWIWRWCNPHVVDNVALASNQFDVDAYQSQAQRKLSGGVGLLFTMGYGALEGLGPTNLYLSTAIDLRFLMKLP